MAVDLESMRAEIQTALEESPLAIFYGSAGLPEAETIFWDINSHPDFRQFLTAAQKAGVRLMVFHQGHFTQDEIDDVRDRLEQTSISREDRRSLDNRIREIQKYEGFTSRLELSFSLDNRTYIYNLVADWYRTWDDVVSEIEAVEDESGDMDDDSLSGYFSAN